MLLFCDCCNWCFHFLSKFHQLTFYNFLLEAWGLSYVSYLLTSWILVILTVLRFLLLSSSFSKSSSCSSDLNFCSSTHIKLSNSNASLLHSFQKMLKNGEILFMQFEQKIRLFQNWCCHFLSQFHQLTFYIFFLGLVLRLLPANIMKVSLFDNFNVFPSIMLLF